MLKPINISHMEMGKKDNIAALNTKNKVKVQPPNSWVFLKNEPEKYYDIFETVLQMTRIKKSRTS